MALISRNHSPWHYSLLLGVLSSVLLISAVSGYGYSQDFEGYLGETIMLHGVSYTGDTIYLFMTGPGLPANGVPLTDPTKRADQGSFTVVGLGSDQTWSYKWDTSKLGNHIDPGTYLVYAVNAPADASDLDGHSYQTLSVYLKDGKLSKDRISVGAQYTLNLADDEPATAVLTTTTTILPLSSPVTTVPVTTVPIPSPTPLQTTKSPLPAAITIVALISGSLCILHRKTR